MARRHSRPRADRRAPDPYAVLGLAKGASADEIRRARNRLAKRQHPDLGGDHDAMQLINEAAAAALADVDGTGSAPSSMPETAPRPPADPAPTPPRRVGRDHPSFTIEALPAEAFEALLIAASILGQVGDDEPPYRLDVLLAEPADTWCRLDLVPDGGGSTVSLTVSTNRLDVGVNEVRDRFVAELNRLDWDDDGPRRRPPW